MCLQRCQRRAAWCGAVWCHAVRCGAMQHGTARCGAPVRLPAHCWGSRAGQGLIQHGLLPPRLQPCRHMQLLHALLIQHGPTAWGTGPLLGCPPKCHPAAWPQAQAEFCRAGRSAWGCCCSFPRSAGMCCCPRPAAPRCCADASAGQGSAGSGCSRPVGPCRGAVPCLWQGGYRHSAAMQEDPASWLTL